MEWLLEFHGTRQMIVRNNITEVDYNVQTTVDAKNNLLIDYKVTNSNDSKAMGYMLRRAKSTKQQLITSNDTLQSHALPEA